MATMTSRVDVRASRALGYRRLATPLTQLGRWLTVAAFSLPVTTTFATAIATTACAPRATEDPSTPVQARTSETTIGAFAVSTENLNVDKVGLRDGFLKPDGNRDLAFTATINGPFKALFVVSTNVKGEPVYGLRADTLVGSDEIPPELGGVIDTGKMTIGIGVVEDGKFINADSGAARGGSGPHSLTLYVANTATLQAGSYVRVYVKTEDNAILSGPITPY